MLFKLKLVTIALAAAAATPALADYPERDITLIVPYAAGSNVDAAARYMADRLQEGLDTTIVIENKPGAGGIIGADYVSRAEADGYTMLFTTSSAMAVAPAVETKVRYKPLTDFEPVAGLLSGGAILQVSNTLPVGTLDELIAYGKEHQGELSYGSPGIGTVQHMAGASFAEGAGLDLLHVPYGSNADATVALLGGFLQILFGPSGPAAANLESGKVNVLAAMGPSRALELPHVPTVAELGHPELEQPSAWFGFFLPAGAPKEVQNRLIDAAETTFSDPEVATYIERFGLNADSLMTGDALRELNAKDLGLFGALGASIGLVGK